MSSRRGKQRGFLFKNTKSWVGQWWEPMQTPDGKRKWITRRRALCPAGRTETEAQRIFDEAILNQLEVHSRYPQTLATLGEFWKTKFEPTLKYYKRKGQEHYYYIVEKLILPGLGGLQMREIGLDQVQALVDQKFAEDYSPQTLRHIRNALSHMFKYAKQLKWYSGDLPTVGMLLPEADPRERVALSGEQFLRLMRELPSPAQEMVLLLGLLGLRRSELVGLKWKRLNLTEETILVEGEAIPAMTAAIREQFVRVARRQKVDPITKKKSPANPDEAYGQYQTLKKAAAKRESSAKRNLPLQKFAVQLLGRIQASSSFVGPDDPVFANETGRPVDPSNILKKKIKPVLKRLSLPDMSWHDLRHTCNTWAGEYLSVEQRKKIFGWSQDRMASHYSHPEMEGMRSGMEKIVEMLGLDEKEGVLQ